MATADWLAAGALAEQLSQRHSAALKLDVPTSTESYRGNVDSFDAGVNVKMLVSDAIVYSLNHPRLFNNCRLHHKTSSNVSIASTFLYAATVSPRAHLGFISNN